MRPPDRPPVRVVGRSLVLVAAAVLLVAATLGGCFDGGSDDPQSFDGEGLVERAEIVAGPNSTLSAELTVDAASNVALAVVATGDDRTIRVPTPSEPTASQTIPVVGLRAETTYDVEVVAEDATGTTETVDLSFRTGRLPEDLPPLTVDVSDPERMDPGTTIFNARFWGPPEDSDLEVEPREDNGYIVAVDDEGNVVWYYRTRLEVTDVSATPRGTLLVSVHDVMLREIDVLGHTIREWGSRVATDYAVRDFAGNEYASELTEPIPVDSAHHELSELATGNLITISTEVVELPDGAGDLLCPDDPPERVISDVIVELRPDGTVVEEWPLTDYFDPVQRPGAEMCAEHQPFAPPNWFYPEAGDTRDWTHANAAAVDETTNTLMVSIRHLDSVIGIRYRDDDEGPAGELKWDLSEEGTLELVGNGEWPRHQHAVEPQADGTILLYDNGNNRPGTTLAGGDEPPYSRAVQYRVDEQAATVEEVWEHRDVADDGAPVYARFLSDADRLANGNVLVTHGGASTRDDVLYARLVEVVPGSEGDDDEVVFDLVVGDREALGWTVYRAGRLPPGFFASSR